MTARTPSLDSALAPLLEALDETALLLRQTHPDLPLDEDCAGAAPDVLLADALLFLMENLRAAARAYHRERHLTLILPQL